MDKTNTSRALLLLTGLTTVLASVSVPAGPRYGASDLGVIHPTITGPTYSQGAAINDSGLMAGFGTQLGTSPLQALVADSTGTTTPITQSSLGGSHAQAMAINANGDVVGSAFLTGDSVYHASLWKAGKATDLGTLGGSNSRALAINDLGEIVGASDVTGNGAEHAVLWSGGQRTDLGALPGGGFSQANGINTARQVTGYSAAANGQQHAFLWQSGAMTDLGTLGGRYSEGRSINGAGTVVGYSTVTGDAEQHAALWSPGKPPTDIGTLGGAFSDAYAINDAGKIVGTSSLPRNEQTLHGFLYENGAMVDVNSLLPAGGPLLVTHALAISADGLIAGIAKREGLTQTGAFSAEYHAVVLTPDRTPPQITCPAASVSATQPAGLGTAVATDNLDPAPTIANNAPTPFAADAITQVTWTATDGAGNQAQCTQLVSVGSPPPGSRPIQPPSAPQNPGSPETPVLPPATDAGTSTPNAPGTSTPASPSESGNSASANPIAATGARLVLQSQLAKPAAKKLKLGTKLILRTRIDNAGTATANDLALEAPLSGKLRFLKAVPSQGGCTAPARTKSNLGGTLRCQLGSLAPGQAVTVEVTAQARKRGAVLNSGLVSMSGGASASTELQVKVR